MQGIKAGQEESRKQIAALQEGSEKLTALLKAESAKSTVETAKLASAVGNLRSEIKEDNKRLADSLTAKFEAAHHKIRKDFDAKLSAEIVTVSAKIDTVQKDTESEMNKQSSTIDEVYARVNGKIDINLDQTKEVMEQTREEMAQYVNDKFRSV
jgi:hypothetical protein